MTAYWEPAGERCPRCGSEIEQRVERRPPANGAGAMQEYVTAERCFHCRWHTDLTGKETQHG